MNVGTVDGYEPTGQKGKENWEGKEYNKSDSKNT